MSLKPGENSSVKDSCCKGWLKKTLPLLLFLLVVAVVFGLMTFHQVKLVDYGDHLEWTKKMAEEGYVYNLPHTLFAKSVIILRALIPYNLIAHLSNRLMSVVNYKSYDIAAIVLLTAAYVLTAWLLWKKAFKVFTDKGIRQANLLAILAAGIVLLVGPIFFFTYPRQLYIGYFSPNPLQSPTYLLLRPLALLWFGLTCEHFWGSSRWKTVIYAVLLILLGTASLPLFSLTFAPAIGLVFLVFYVRRWKELNWRLMLSMAAAVVIILGVQFWVSYTSPGSDRILIAPFKSMLHWTGKYWLILLKTLMSIAFPLYVTLYYWKTTKKDLSYRLAWFTFLVALLFAILLAEQEKYTHGNFFWGPMLAIFILFVLTNIQYLGDVAGKLQTKTATWKDAVPGLLLLLHLACGIIYFINSLSANALIL